MNQKEQQPDIHAQARDVINKIFEEDLRRAKKAEELGENASLEDRDSLKLVEAWRVEDWELEDAKNWIRNKGDEKEDPKPPRPESHQYESGEKEKRAMRLLIEEFKKYYPVFLNESKQPISSLETIKARYKMIQVIAEQGNTDAQKLLKEASSLSVFIFETRAVGIIDQYEASLLSASETYEDKESTRFESTDDAIFRF